MVAQDSTIATCQDLLSEFASCLVDTFPSQNDAAICDTCRLEYAELINNSTEPLSCDDVESVQCLAVKECPCGECKATLEEYLNCEVISNYNGGDCSAGIDCRTSIVNCEHSFDEYRNCIYRLPISNNDTTANGKMCDACRLDIATNFLSGGTCDMARSNFCLGVNDTCVGVCGNCIDELDFFFTCDVLDKSDGDCNIDCNTAPTPPVSNEPLCDEELSQFAFCITQELESDGVPCDSCRVNVETSVFESFLANSQTNTCNNVHNVSCNEAIPTCEDSCGTCTSLLASYWICYMSVKSFLECSTYSCNLVSPPSMMVLRLPTAAPTSLSRIPTSAPISSPVTISPVLPTKHPDTSTPLSTRTAIPINQPTNTVTDAMPSVTSSTSINIYIKQIRWIALALIFIEVIL